jgi:hypothetical protein
VGAGSAVAGDSTMTVRVDMLLVLPATSARVVIIDPVDTTAPTTPGERAMRVDYNYIDTYAF